MKILILCAGAIGGRHLGHARRRTGHHPLPRRVYRHCHEQWPPRSATSRVAAPRERILASPHFVNLGAARRKIRDAPRAQAIERFRAMLSAPGSMLTASMLRDLENCSSIEADQIAGNMLVKARAHGETGGH